METTSKDGMSEPSKGQLVFIDRVVYEDEDTPVEMKNEPVIFDHKEELDIGGGEYQLLPPLKGRSLQTEARSG